jgi:hypothetical protein
MELKAVRYEDLDFPEGVRALAEKRSPAAR